jgi:hypothetical protein
MLGAIDAPAELDRAGERGETLANCQGPDACRGTDAGNTFSTHINLTDDFSWTGEETITYYGETSNSTAYSSTSDDNNDGYILDLPVGYGYTVDVSWNYTGATFWDNYAFMLSLNPGDGCAIAYFTCDWGYHYYSTTGFLSMGTDGTMEGGTYGGWYDAEPPIDLVGESSVIWVMCYYCYQSGIAMDYTMNITVWTGDGGMRGDVTSPQYNVLLDMPDEPFSWSYQSDDFDLSAGSSADLVVTYCDVWCDPETSIEVTKPDGTSDSFALTDYFTGWLATYSDAGTYTVEKYDTYGDGGMGLNVGVSIGNFSALLQVDDFVYDDMASGHVDSTTDTSDIYAIWVPENYKANLTLHWENSADLDLELYSDYDPATETLSGKFEYSWFDQPEYIDIGQLGDETMIFAEVLHYSGPSTGYILEYMTEPGAPPPCFFQDDGQGPGDGVFSGAGEDATEGAYAPDDTPIDVTNLMDADGNGQFEGMMCSGYDESDWYQITVPAGDGVWAMLEWPEGIDTNFNDTIEIEGDIDFGMYMITSAGYSSFVSSSYGFHPQAVATNESYSWTNDLGVDSVVHLRLNLNEMTEDYESNYSVTFSTYNATEEPWQMACQNDAGLAPINGCADAGSDYTTSLNLTTVNQTFEGYGHDSMDNYDYYRIFLPDNYAFEVCVEFPGQNDIDLAIYYVNPTYGWLSFVASSYNDNPECAWAQYDDAGQDLYIRVMTDRGSGNYEVSISLATPGLAPGDSQDDCGMAGSVPGGDAADLIYPGSWSGHTFTNDSTQADLNPYDANGSVRSMWDGGVCTGWISYTWDSYDMYSIAVPEGHYVSIDYDMDLEGDGDASTYHSVYMLMCQNQHMPCQYPANGAFYVATDSGYGMDELTQNSGLWPVGTMHNASGCDTAFPNPECAVNGWDASNAVTDTPGWVYVYFWTCCGGGDDPHEYEMNISFLPLSELEGGVQNDANSGMDAGPGPSTAIHVDDYVNATNNTLSWGGWNMAGVDSTDRFTFDVPANHGVNIELSHGYDVPDVWMILDIFDNSWNQVGMSAWTAGGQTFNYTTASPADSWVGIGVRNWGTYDDVGTNYTVNVTFYTLDTDGDGWLDELEILCNTDPNDSNSTPTDTDGDGECDFIDEDIDGDGIGNDLDEMPLDENGTNDLDGDGISDEIDQDIDGDGWSNIAEDICLGSTSFADMNASVTPTDYDGDGLCDITEDSELDHSLASTYLDADGDNDGTDDETDAFDFDECADTDTDGDRLPDSINTGLLSDPADENSTLLCVPSTPDNLTADDDDDGDGHLDTYETDCGSDPLLSTDMPIDSTLDMSLDGYSNGLCDALDPDDDNDGVNDTEDLWPYDSTEWSDADGDGQGDNRDMDDDNDGWWDSCDTSAWLAAQNASTIESLNYFPDETDGVANTCPDNADAFPLDGAEWLDTDGDGVGNNADIDDDGQSTGSPEAPGNFDWTDAEEAACGTNPLDHDSVPDDADGDYICDLVDDDDDNDGVLDSMDAFPLDETQNTDSDGDGQGDINDPDDDGDGWTDLDEEACLTDSLDAMDVPTDNDNDNVCDLVDGDDDTNPDLWPQYGDNVIDLDDAFPLNPLESVDSDGDGIGDNSDPDDDNDGWLDAQEVACANAGGGGNKDSASDMPFDLDGDGICDAVDPDDDGDGYPDPACVNTGIGSPSTEEYVECATEDEDRFPRDSTEWFDANEDELGDNGNPVTLIDQVMFDPTPYLGIAVAIGAAGYGLLQLNRNAGQGTEDEAEDYTEDFEDFEFEDEEDEDPSEDDEDGQED